VSFRKALEKNAVPRRLGDVTLQVDTSLWIGRADKPPRALYATLGLLAGLAFGLATLSALLTGEDTPVVVSFLVPAVIGFAAAAWFEQRDRRQRAFVVDFVGHVLRLDFSTPLSGMPRTLKVPFEQVRDIALSAAGGAQVLTVDFELSEQLFREVLAANVTPVQAADAERVKRMIRAAVGLEKPSVLATEPEQPGAPPPPVDSFS
jgi:hypothetical protein